MQHYSRTIKAALNRRSHAEGRAHGEAVKARLLADLDRMRAEGATHADLLARITGGTDRTTGGAVESLPRRSQETAGYRTRGKSPSF